MLLRTLTILALVTTSACNSKSDEGKPAGDKTAAGKAKADPSPGDKPGSKGATRDESAGTPATEKPAGNLPVGSSLYKNETYKFEVVTATSKPTEQQHNLPESGVEGRMFLFSFRDRNLGMGEVLTAKYVSDGKFDVNRALDGAVNRSVEGMGLAMTGAVKKDEDNGRPARQYAFSGDLRGYKVAGRGRAIAVDDRRVTIAFALWRAGVAEAEAEGARFVDSFRAE